MTSGPLHGTRPPAYDLATIQRLLRGGAGAIALRIMGDRWSLLILRDILLGARRFEELRRLTGAARGTLISRLNALVSLGILYRNPYLHSSTRHEYRLTDKGLGLYPAAMMLWSWESKWGGQHNLPHQLIHEGCGRAMLPQLACTHCRETIVPQQVTFAPGPGIGGKLIEPARYRRREGPSGSGDASFAHAIDIVGDQWATLVIAAIFFRVRRYDEMQKALDVATNILADRLRRMVRSGVVQRVPYQQHPPRYEYQLTPKGLDLYGFTAALHSWAEKWVVGRSGPVLELRHKPCGHALKTMLVCSECGQAFGAAEVSAGGRLRRSIAKTTGAVAARR